MARPELPRGEVTFLFTDIEGSTRLIDELGEDGYVEALTDHRLLLRTAFAAHSGVEVDTQGDAFLYAFADAAAAVAAAAAGQEALERRPVKVRVGLHTAEPLLTAEGYAGASYTEPHESPPAGTAAKSWSRRAHARSSTATSPHSASTV